MTNVDHAIEQTEGLLEETHTAVLRAEVLRLRMLFASACWKMELVVPCPACSRRVVFRVEGNPTLNRLDIHGKLIPENDAPFAGGEYKQDCLVAARHNLADLIRKRYPRMVERRNPLYDAVLAEAVENSAASPPQCCEVDAMKGEAERFNLEIHAIGKRHDHISDDVLRNIKGEAP